MAAAPHGWALRASLRRNAFGWSGTREAIKRLNEAVGEIERVARTDPALAGEGAVLLLEKLSPAVNQIDSSSGALGNASNGVVEGMVPLIAAAPVPRHVREKWLERLFDAIQDGPAQHRVPGRASGRPVCRPGACIPLGGPTPAAGAACHGRPQQWHLCLRQVRQALLKRVVPRPACISWARLLRRALGCNMT